jgi:hypothetical protein
LNIFIIFNVQNAKSGGLSAMRLRKSMIGTALGAAQHKTLNPLHFYVFGIK